VCAPRKVVHGGSSSCDNTHMHIYSYTQSHTPWLPCTSALYLPVYMHICMYTCHTARLPRLCQRARSLYTCALEHYVYIYIYIFISHSTITARARHLSLCMCAYIHRSSMTPCKWMHVTGALSKADVILIQPTVVLFHLVTFRPFS